MHRSCYALVLFIGTCAFAQAKESSTFVLDSSKPYVYLKFDHIGPRKGMQGEGPNGLWLRVVNNCKLSIVFSGTDLTDGPGFIIEDEVVELKPGIQIFSDEEIAQTKERERLRKLNLKHKPDGYWFETSGILRVLPGKEMLFSVPLNHVDEDWYLRVKFALEITNSSVAVGPFTYLDFYKWDIPKSSPSDAAPSVDASKGVKPSI